jgi:hypothetical protein
MYFAVLTNILLAKETLHTKKKRKKVVKIQSDILTVSSDSR